MAAAEVVDSEAVVEVAVDSVAVVVAAAVDSVEDAVAAVEAVSAVGEDSGVDSEETKDRRMSSLWGTTITLARRIWSPR